MLKFYFNQILLFLNYDLYYPISLIFLSFLTLIFFLKIDERKKIKIYFFTFLLLTVVFLLWSLYLSFQQYFLWKNHPLSKFLLPPYQKINYYLNYAYFHFWRDFVYRLLGSFFIFLWLKFLEFIFQREVFYDEEKILLPLLGLFFFFPYNLLFVFLGFFMLLLVIIMNFVKKGVSKEKRFSFKIYWLFLAWLIFILEPLIFTHYFFLQFKP